MGSGQALSQHQTALERQAQHGNQIAKKVGLGEKNWGCMCYGLCSPLKSLGLFHLEFCFSRCLGPFSMRAAPYLLLGLIIICDSKFLFHFREVRNVGKGGELMGVDTLWVDGKNIVGKGIKAIHNCISCNRAELGHNL
ncbi:hypothetical protein YC2023_107476 [Brassica napus]